MKNLVYRETSGTKDAIKQYQGMVNKAVGRNFENLIDIALAHYAQRGDAIIEKTPEPMRPIKALGGGKFIAHYEKQAQPDYKGALKNGRAVVFEAKHTTGDRITHSRITSDQAVALDKYDEIGAECFVVIGFNMSDFFRVPWPVFRDMKSIWGRKYIKPSDIKEYALGMGRFGQPLILG
jgi:recombination protein U